MCDKFGRLYPVAVAIVVMCTFLQGCLGDLCVSGGVDALDHIHEHSTPKGGVHAGKYTKDEKADSIEKCLVSCCQSLTCGALLFYQEACFLIECNLTVPDACEPVARSEEKYAGTLFINVRTLAEVAAKSGSQSGWDLPQGGSQEGPLIKTDCDPSEAQSCGHNELCKLEVNSDLIGYVCECEEDYIRDPVSHTCISRGEQGDKVQRTKDMSCEYGLLDTCEKNEECVTTHSRSRVGKCVCVENYSRNSDTGWCEEITEKTKEMDKESSSTSSSKPTTLSTVQMSKKSTTTPQPRSTWNASSIGMASVPITSTIPPAVVTTGAVPAVSTVSTTIMPKPTTTSNVTTKQSTTSTVTTKQSTTSTVTTKPIKLEPLVVSVGDDKILTLPQNEVTLDAYTLPKDTNNEYQYQWSLTSHPEGDQVGDMGGINTNKLKLSNLIEGLYTFKIAVSAEGKYGEATVNVTVQPPQRVNKMPVAIVKPTFQKVNQPNNVVLDGSESTDDDKIVKYHWEQASGPLNTQKIDDSDMEKPMLNLLGLSPGEYRFKLTVTDSDNAQNSVFANVTVIKETDYPPKANAGPNMIINLPQNNVKLYGNASTDDKGITSYEWIKKSGDKLTADMTGVRTPVLLLENLELGDYTFTLKVTDTAGQTATADVSVFVRAEHNKPPTARAGLSKTIWMPVDHATLNGSNSTDDQKVTQYKWTQVSGPTTVTIEGADKVVANVSNLKIGEYKFKVTVKDKDGLESSSTTSINVKENQNRKPEAKAGGNQVVTLPAPLVVLDGSQSSDDKAIVSYLWSREDDSLAAGEVVNRSDHKAILQLANLVAGRYVFTLQVVDAEGLSSEDKASVLVRPEENRDDLIEMQIETNIGQFTVSRQRTLEQQLALLLHSSSAGGDTKVDIQHLEMEKISGNLIVTFKVVMTGKDVNVVWSGPEVKEILKKKLRANKDVLDFKVVNVDTVVCQNNCSGHGHCDQNSKLCICEAFWMENFFKAYIMEHNNCDWSVLYVIIIAMIAVLSLAAVVWACICLCRRCKCDRKHKTCAKLVWNSFRPKKRHRYTLLAEIDDDKNDVEMLPKGKLQSSSLMVSESDFSSDEETLFINKKANGHVKNGLIKAGKTKVRT